jgi:hypothetical protein
MQACSLGIKKMSRARSYGMATTSVDAKVQTFFISAKFGKRKSGETAYSSNFLFQNTYK